MNINFDNKQSTCATSYCCCCWCCCACIHCTWCGIISGTPSVRWQNVVTMLFFTTKHEIILHAMPLNLVPSLTAFTMGLNYRTPWFLRSTAVPSGTAEHILATVILSVCLSVTTRYRIKPRWDRDSGFSPYDSLESPMVKFGAVGWGVIAILPLLARLA